MSRQRPLHGWLEELEPGASFESRGRTITETDIVGFGTLTGDLHPAHLDARWAAGSRAGERVAHGMLVASYALGLLDLDEEMLVCVRRIDELAFERAVPVGATIHAEGRIESVRELDEAHGVLTLQLSVVTDSGPCVTMTVEALWLREPGTPDERLEPRAGRGRFSRVESVSSPTQTPDETEPIPL